MKFRDSHLYAERVTAVYGGGPTSTGEWTPAVDVYETKDRLVLVAEVAGVQQDDICVEVVGNIITLRGGRPFTRKGVSTESYYRMECAYGTFERSFTLPFAVSESDIQAILKNGVLTVTLPHHGAGGKRHIEVSNK